MVTASLILSASSLIIVLKDRSRRPYAGDLEEFRAETERLIAEFNRVAERDISLLDDRVPLVQAEIRRARKAEEALKKALEEALRAGIFEEAEKAEKTAAPKPHPKEAFAYSKDEPPLRDEPSDESALFEGFSVSRIKNYAKHRNSPQKKHELLLQYLKENKNREELIEMGFSANEINLAMLSLSTHQEDEN